MSNDIKHNIKRIADALEKIAKIMETKQNKKIERFELRWNKLLPHEQEMIMKRRWHEE